MTRFVITACLSTFIGIGGALAAFAQASEEPPGASAPAPAPANAEPAPPPSSAAEPAAPTEEYVVVEGDTLGSIAERLTGDEGNWEEIARANGIDDPTKLAVGKRLKIPAELRAS